MKRLLLFDVDGTLLDALGAGRAALRAAMLSVYGETGPIDEFEFQGKTDPAIVRALLRCEGYADAAIDEGLEALWEPYGVRLDRELEARRGLVEAHPGVTALLGALAGDARFTVGLVTGNVEGGAWMKLHACGLDGEFSFGAFGSDSEHREELPPLAVERARARTGDRFSLEQVVVIGDTPDDIRCARASGVRVLAVATGGYTAAELARHDPDDLLPGLLNLDRALQVLAGPWG